MSDQVPALRFEGFTDPWEQRKLGDFTSITTGSSNQQDANPKGAYPFFVRSAKVERSDKYIFDCEAILIPGEGRIGEIFHYYNGKFDCHQRVYKISGFNGTDAKFIMYAMMRSFRKHALENTSKATVDSIRLPTLTEFELSLPSVGEQRQISSFFARLDSLITLHQRKHEKLVLLKKSLLEKMFPREGETTPELRFEGFTDPWEQRKLGDIAMRLDNFRVPISAANRIPGNTPYYGANGVQDYVSGFTHKGEFVLIAEDGASDLDNYPTTYISGSIWVNNHAHVIQGMADKSINQYLTWALKRCNIKPLLTGGTRAKLTARVLMGIGLPIPSKAEQRQIGSLFTRLDSLITLHQRKLDRLIILKQSLLEKMFV